VNALSVFFTAWVTFGRR